MSKSPAQISPSVGRPAPRSLLRINNPTSGRTAAATAPAAAAAATAPAVFSPISSWRKRGSISKLSGIAEKLFDHQVDSVMAQQSGPNQCSRSRVELALLLLLYWIRTGTDFDEMALIFHLRDGTEVKEAIDDAKGWMTAKARVSYNESSVQVQFCDACIFHFRPTSGARRT